MAKSISLEDLVALNDEIAGLVRAGVPLEIGLASWGRDLPGALGRIAKRLSLAAAEGQSLPDALAAERNQIPPVYSALVTAGMKSGRLPAALESLSTTARNLADVRGAVGLAVLYPLILVLLSYGLLVFLSTYVISSMMLVYEIPPPKSWVAIAALGSFANDTIGGTVPWLLIPPLAILLLAAIWWRQTRRAIVMDTGSAGRWLRWVPVAGHVVQDARAAALAEILGLLVEHGVPLDEAIVLAAECTADQGLVNSARSVSATLRLGGVPDTTWKRQLTGFPPLLAWLVTAGGRQQTFSTLARHVADTYRRRIRRESLWLTNYLPIWLTIVVGGSVVAVYGLSLFLPFTELLNALGGPLATDSMRIKP